MYTDLYAYIYMYIYMCVFICPLNPTYKSDLVKGRPNFGSDLRGVRLVSALCKLHRTLLLFGFLRRRVLVFQGLLQINKVSRERMGPDLGVLREVEKTLLSVCGIMITIRRKRTLLVRNTRTPNPCDCVQHKIHPYYDT